MTTTTTTTGTSVPRTILLVDDDPATREGLRELLELSPAVRIVGEATDGAEAVALAATLHPDCVVMDVQMPRMDGIEATRRIKAASPAICIVMLTMYRIHQPAAILAGADAFLTKGDGIAALLRVLSGAG